MWTVEKQFPVPREVDAYKTTTHFMERLKYRTDPEPSKEIVKDCLKYGTIKRTHEAQRIIFEHDIGRYTWRVLAQINDEAFTDSEKYHTLLTVYETNNHEYHKTVFDDE